VIVPINKELLRAGGGYRRLHAAQA